MAYLGAAADACGRIYEVARGAVARGSFPLFLGGDHSLALGTIGGVTEEEPIGVLWIDAHTDINTPETSPSGNLHGMPLAHLLGLGLPSLRALAGPKPAVDAQHVALLGVRSVDAGERELVKKTGVRVYTMSEIDERGFAVCLKEAMQRVTDGTCGFHLSFDLDGVDPRYAPGVGTPVP